MDELKTIKNPVILSITGDCQDDTKKKSYSCQKEYEPYMFGNTENPIDYSGAVIHLIRSTIGTGILVLPYAFKNVGYVVGILGCIFIGILYMNTVHALLFTEYELCKRLRVSNLTFVRVVEETFMVGPKCLRKFSGFFKSLMYFYYGVPTGNAIYLIIIATNMRGIFDSISNHGLNLQQAITIIVIPVTLLCMIPKLKFLVPFSTLTNVFTLINVGVITFYSMDLSRIRPDVKPVEDLRFAPQFFAMVLQSLYATGIILPLKNDMRRPKDFASPLGVMNVAFVVLIVLYATFGFLGYLNYGADVKDNVLSNLPPGHVLTATVYLLYSLALCVTYTLLFYVYFDTIWTNIVKSRVEKTGYETIWAYGLRLGLSVMAYVMAVAVPNFALFTSIVGTIGILLEIALPALLQMILLSTSNYNKMTVYRIICKNFLILALAFPMCVMSFKCCVEGIIKMYGTK